MDKIHMYGIPNCDTIKKARRWLDAEGVEFQFHDYRKQGITKSLLQGWIKKVDWESLINRRGTTWRKLSDDLKNSVDEALAIKLMVENPSMIKRPVLLAGSDIEVGFTAERYMELLKK